MSRVLRLALVLLVAGASCTLQASIDAREFSSVEEEERFARLTAELRCPKCQNQNIADSNAPIAQDLKERTYTLLREGKSDAEIVGYLQARYGDFITYRPPLRASTLLLWLGPALLFGAAALVLAWRLRRRAGINAAPTTPDATRVARILEQHGGRDGGEGA